MHAGLSSKVITRHRNGRIHAYTMAGGALGALEPAAVFHPRPGDELEESAVWPDLKRAVYTTVNSVVCLRNDGKLLWTADFRPHSDRHHGNWPGCALSLDGRAVWVYRPDVIAGRGQADQWVVHDANSGEVLARHQAETAGHGGSHHVHPVDGSVYLDIGEGQDGSVILRGVPGENGEVEFVTYPWPDRCMIAVSPDGQQFMTVDHEQGDVAFHRHPSGEVLFTLPVEAFGYEAESTVMEWSGGYLTPDLAVVPLAGEDEDEEEWFSHHLVDLRTGTPSGELATEATDPYGLVPLGDGTWLTGGPDGNLFRSALAPQPS
ncbi:hypothetical protein [Streptomyces sp. NBC_00525]|uniref:hypothetical protein n=1 Tax=Streptomyces sp. NBC_00525 TaxID=2903660 RepID=UPI003FCEB4A1